MDFPSLLLVLLVAPFAVAAIVIAVSQVRRRRQQLLGAGPTEPVHRGQADTAAVQDARVYPQVAGAKVQSGRERRAGH
jgi:hypothetical protein